MVPPCWQSCLWQKGALAYEQVEYRVGISSTRMALFIYIVECRASILDIAMMI